MADASESIAQALAWAKSQLTESDSAALDARVLLTHVLDVTPIYLMTWPEKSLTAQQWQSYSDLIQQRQQGTPVAHLLGYRDFWTLSLKVSPATLIPRPETEILVEQALSLPLPNTAKVLDLGTGTGAIALALASEKPDWQVYGVDLIDEAVALARENAQNLNLQHVDIQQSCWFESVTETDFDLIVSNPPYVENDSPYLQQGDVRFEPLSALTSGKDGLDDIRHIICQARQHLGRGGWLMIEHGYTQAPAIQQLLSSAGFINVQSCNDLAALPRITFGSFKA